MKSEGLFRDIMNEVGSIDSFVLKREAQNSEYEGLLLIINKHVYRSRLAKLTPKKKGYFVAFWEKDTKGINQAYSYENSPEKLIVSVIDNERRGQFIFPKKALLKYGILKSPKQKGKMALRVYPSWVTELNTNAAKTQTWQVEYFIDLSDAIDVDKLKKLYFL
ncbi:MepB family protein [Bacillus norwichensis]|uniref:MepB family protein n=1 Tax=Bacillus norwichensis TaxID=2762217 RepID=A0ABR8VJY4_9BACI|nr:MepB family protein [Bacillus norwichensis]MBD8005068.1 MepB family protein [Bacillus norwichensis]